ncbi:DUF2087 domain-containing protein [Brevibacterium sp. UCMA 11754]|uniref:DUF2087 domain-containing protein n=1 Tax=Brevibacterium sp. UCMA 11754 TaxID=2749198 RepID=UPI001F2A2D79|nr:DUF2087 domain-containing protein [Brevibacterium sp. UCMA 11754]MCF2571970.1 DUF2087 domain-containing protein [Brevibacterium sp. UCMA 11754]
MTKHKDFKRLVRQRMSSTGENFTSARVALLEGRVHEHQSHNASPPTDPKADAFRAKTLRTFMSDGRLVSIPSKRKALVVILLEILRVFETDRIYREKDVNSILEAFHPDFARLRRELIDYRYLSRDAHTGQYWVNNSLPERSERLGQETAAFETFLR